MQQIKNLCYDLYLADSSKDNNSLDHAAMLFLQSREEDAERLLSELLKCDLHEKELQACGDILFALLISQERFNELKLFGFPRNSKDELMIRLYSVPSKIRCTDTVFMQEMPEPVIENLPMIGAGINGHTVDLLFDTGAMSTVVSESLAKKCGLEKTSETMKAGGNTGDKTETSFAVVPNLQIGSITAFNKGALVLPDVALDFGVDENKKPMRFDGFLGWNVIKDLRWTVDMKERKIAAERSKPTAFEKNMCWDFYPMLRVQSEGKDLVFCLDTGNTETSFGETMKRHFKTLGIRTDSMAGVGGTIEEQVYTAEKFLFTVCGHTVKLADIPIYNRKFSYSSFFTTPGVLASDIAKDKIMIIDYPNRHFEIK